MKVEYHAAVASPDIRFSEAAVKHLVSELEKHLEYRGVRLSVKKQGCSGYAYILDYVTTPDPSDVTLSLTNDYLVAVDKKSLPYLQGMSVDYVKQGLNAKFVFHNPNQTGQCGCGESFTVD